MRRTGMIYGGTLLAGIALAGAAQAQAYGQAYAPAPAHGGGYAVGQCGPGGCGAPGPVGYGPGQPTQEAYPPAAQPGQCFTKVLVPETTETFSEHVLVSPEKTELSVTPGPSTIEEKRVLVKDESALLINIPATFRTETETVVVRPGYTRSEVVPAVYDSVTEQVKVRDGYTDWRPGALVAGHAPGSANTHPGTSRPAGTYGAGVIEHNPVYGGMTTRELPTGEVLCLVEVPPEYRTITRQVLRTPARSVEVPVPPETRVITRQVVETPAHVEKRIVPAVYDTVKVTVHGPDVTQPYTVPAVYGDYTRIRVAAPSRFEWKQVDCRTEVAHPQPVYAPPVYVQPAPCCAAQPVYAQPAYPQPAPCCAAPQPAYAQPQYAPPVYAPRY